MAATVPLPIPGYNSRFTATAPYDLPGVPYDEVLFIAGQVVQNSELNELQESIFNRITNGFNTLFQDGAVVKDCAVTVNAVSGAVTAGAGVLWVSGNFRGVSPGTFTIAVTGTVQIGVWVNQYGITYVQDPTLLDPSVGFDNTSEPGAGRLRTDLRWGFPIDGTTGADGTSGVFHPVYTVNNGILQTTNAPPNIDAIAQAIAHYDRESTGGYYVADGLAVQAQPNVGANQIYSVAEGEARVNGNDIIFPTATTVAYAATPDLANVLGETQLSTVSGAGTQTVTTNFAPIATVDLVLYTQQKDVTVVHGVSGSADALPDTTVSSIVAVNQGGTWGGSSFTGGTTYVQGTSFKLTGNTVDWSIAGANPQPSGGSSYTTIYDATEQATVSNVSDTSFQITWPSGGIVGSNIEINYHYKMPRIDLLCLNPAGLWVWVKGVASLVSPAPPGTPVGLLLVATVNQTWYSATVAAVNNNAVTTLTMGELANMNTDIDNLYNIVSFLWLNARIANDAPASKVGVFADPFIDDRMRDLGQSNTAAIVNGGLLTLPISTVTITPQVSSASTLPVATETLVLQQQFVTGGWVCNPQAAFPPIPAKLTLSPNLDLWPATGTPATNSEISDRFWVYGDDIPTAATAAVSNGPPSLVRPDRSHTPVIVVPSRAALATPPNNPTPTINTQSVTASISGWHGNEHLQTLLFDGNVIPLSGQADGSGNLSIAFTIPAGIPAGAKSVKFSGANGSACSATFLCRNQITEQEHCDVRLPHSNTVVATWGAQVPVYELFTLPTSSSINAIDLWFTAKPGSSSPGQIMIQNCTNGAPNGTIVLGAEIADMSAITLNAWTRVTFTNPAMLQGGTQYAIVYGCTDEVTAVAYAEIGSYDSVNTAWVSQRGWNLGGFVVCVDAVNPAPAVLRDLSFRLWAPGITQLSQTIALSPVTLVNADELTILAAITLPNSNCSAVFTVTLPDSTVVNLHAGQRYVCPTRENGTMTWTVTLVGDGGNAPVLVSSLQLVVGTRQGSPAGTYTARAIPAGNGVNIMVFYEYLPMGDSSVVCQVTDDTFVTWTPVPADTATNMGNGWLDTKLNLASWTGTNAHIQLLLSGSSTNRPQLRNFRVCILP